MFSISTGVINTLIALFGGIVCLIQGLDLPSIKYLKKKGIKSIQWKKLFKEADFRNKYMVILGIWWIATAIIIFAITLIKIIIRIF